MIKKIYITIILNVFCVFLLNAQSQYPKSKSPVILETVKIQIGTQLKDLQVGYIENGGNDFFVVPLPYVDNFTENVLIKDGSNFEPIFDSNKNISFPYNPEPILKVEFRNVFTDQNIEKSVIDALKNKVPSLANKQGKRLNLTSAGRMLTFLEFNTPYGIYRAEGEIPFSAFRNSTFSAFIKCHDILDVFQETIEGLSLSEISMGIEISYTALFSKRDYSLSAEFAEDYLLSSLSEVSSTTGNEKLLFIPMGGNGSQKIELSKKLSNYMSIEIITYKESSASNANNLAENIVTDFINNSLKDYYEQINLANENENTQINLLMSNGISLQTTLGEIKKADFDIDIDKSYKELIETGKTKSGSSGLTFGIPKKFSFGWNSSKNKTRNSKKEIFKTDIEKIKKTFEGEIPILTGISLESMQNFQNAKTSNVYINRHSDAEEQPKSSVIYLDFDTEGSNVNDADVKRMSFNALNQSIRWAQGENIPFQTTDDQNSYLKKRVEYQNQIYDFQYFSDDLKSRLNNTDNQKLNTFKTGYQYLSIHGFIDDLKLENVNESGINKEYTYEIIFKNKTNPVAIYVLQGAFIKRDFYGNPILARDQYGLTIDKTFKLKITITPNSKIETWGYIWE